MEPAEFSLVNDCRAQRLLHLGGTRRAAHLPICVLGPRLRGDDGCGEVVRFPPASFPRRREPRPPRHAGSPEAQAQPRRKLAPGRGQRAVLSAGVGPSLELCLVRFPADMDRSRPHARPCRSRTKAVMLAPGWAAPSLTCADMSPSPLRGGARGGGSQRVIPLRFTPASQPSGACGIGVPLHLPFPCSFTPPPTPPHQGEGDAVALSSPHHPRRVLCQGAHAVPFRR